MELTKTPTYKDKEYYRVYYHQNKHKYINTDEYKTRRSESAEKYYEKHKEAILEKINERVVCECGKIGLLGNMRRHEKSSYHLKRVGKS